MIIKDITPPHLRCLPGTCPGVYEITPEELRCDVGASCPAVLDAGGDLLIIGKKPSPELLAEIEGRVGDDEHAIVISKDYFAELVK